MGGIDIVNSSRCKLPNLPLLNLKEEILGKRYLLSVAFVDEKKSQELNKKYRNKDKPTNVLSFELEKDSGEIVICPKVAHKEAKNFEKNHEEFLGFLVIHGMLHLKGLSHGEEMERKEEFYSKKYLSRTKK